MNRKPTSITSSQCGVFYLHFIVPIQRRWWHPTPLLLPGKSHGWRSLVGWSPWGRWELDTIERFHFHLSLSCIGEGNGNPLQCSCLENPRDGGAWWAAVSGVAQSRTRLKQLSSSNFYFRPASKIINNKSLLFLTAQTTKLAVSMQKQLFWK